METIAFLEIFFVDANKFSFGSSDFFPFSYTRSFCKLTGTSRVKYFSSCHTVFSVMQVISLNFSANAMAQAYRLFQYQSFILRVCTLSTWRKFLPFIILLIDERLIPDCSAIWRGAGVCMWSFFLRTNQFFNLIDIFFSCYWPRSTRIFFSIRGTTIFKTFQKPFYRCLTPVFWWLAFPNVYTQTTLFLQNNLEWWFCFWKHHCEQIVTKRHREQRGSSLTIYSNVM